MKGKRQNQLTDEHIEKIIDTYQHRKEETERYSRRVGMKEIEQNDFNLNISRYVSTAEAEEEIDLEATHGELVKIEKEIQDRPGPAQQVPEGTRPAAAAVASSRASCRWII